MSDPYLPPGVRSDGRPDYGDSYIQYAEKQYECEGCGDLLYYNQVEHIVNEDRYVVYGLRCCLKDVDHLGFYHGRYED
jgi:hypothetical protein